LDQRVVAGIGNVYKSELLFMAAVHPETPVKSLSDETLHDIAGRAGKLLRANVGPGPRITTGQQGRGREAWVYGRAGEPCRRCASAIEESRLGDRLTFWCPTCQARRV
jgi:endonuclease-8